MKKKMFLLICGLCIGSMSLLTMCSKKEVQNKKPLVVTTVGMIYDAALNIAGDEIRLENLMGSGVDPHLYKATAGDTTKLAKADLILYSGLHLEGKMVDVLEKLSKTRAVVGVSESIPVENRLPFTESEFDPHVWFSVQNWKYSVEATYDALCKLLPNKKDLLEKNYSVYIQKLNDLDEYIRMEAAKVPKEKRILITAHDAFNYFARDYGFEVKAPQGVSTVTEAGASDIKNLADFIAEHKIPVMFVESSVSPKNMKALQEAVKDRGFSISIGSELFSDAMGDFGTFEGTYIGMLTHNIDAIVGALK